MINRKDIDNNKIIRSFLIAKVAFTKIGENKYCCMYDVTIGSNIESSRR